MNEMTRLVVDIDDGLNEAFRKKIIARKGFGKGKLKESLIEAIEQWITNGRK